MALEKNTGAAELFAHAFLRTHRYALACSHFPFYCIGAKTDFGLRKIPLVEKQSASWHWLYGGIHGK